MNLFEKLKETGISVAPIMLIVLESARQTAVLEAIRQLPCLSAPVAPSESRRRPTHAPRALDLILAIW